MQDSRCRPGERVLFEGIGMPGSYRDLEIYRVAHQLGIDAHLFTLQLPKFEMYESGQQLRRAAKAVSANIVEGYGRRRYKADFLRFLVYGHASCDESIEWLDYVGDCHPELKSKSQELRARFQELSRRINRFILSVAQQHRV